MNALKNKVITLEHFDMTYYRESDNDNNFSIDQNTHLSLEFKGDDEIKKVSFDKVIYRMDSFDKEILGYSNPI